MLQPFWTLFTAEVQLFAAQVHQRLLMENLSEMISDRPREATLSGDGGIGGGTKVPATSFFQKLNAGL